MKTLKSKINNLVQKKILEDDITEQDFNLFSEVFDSYLSAKIQSSSPEKEEFLKKLNNSVIQKKTAKNKIDSIDRINYLGELITNYMFYYDLTTLALAKITNLDEPILQKVIKNQIRIIEIDPEKMVALLLYFNLTVKKAVELLKKSIFYNYNMQSAKQSLARYSTRDGFEEKGRSMSSGVNELFYHAHKVKPLNVMESSLDSEINTYVANFEIIYRKHAR